MGDYLTPQFGALFFLVLGIAAFADRADGSTGWPYILTAIICLFIFIRAFRRYRSARYHWLSVNGDQVEVGCGKQTLDRFLASTVRVGLIAPRPSKPFRGIVPSVHLPNGVTFGPKELSVERASIIRALKGAGAEIYIEEAPRDDLLAAKRQEVTLTGWAAVGFGLVSAGVLIGMRGNMSNSSPWIALITVLSIFGFALAGMLWVLDRYRVAKGRLGEVSHTLTLDAIAEPRTRTEMEFGKWYRVNDANSERAQIKAVGYLIAGVVGLFVLSMFLIPFIHPDRQVPWEVAPWPVAFGWLMWAGIKRLASRLDHRFKLQNDKLLVDYGDGEIREFPAPAEKRTFTKQPMTIGSQTDRYGPFWGGYRLDHYYLELDDLSESAEEPRQN